MNSVNINIEAKADVTIGGHAVEDVLRIICDICHDGLESVSVTNSECENNPCLNTAKTWHAECEALEGRLCEILDLLGD